MLMFRKEMVDVMCYIAYVFRWKADVMRVEIFVLYGVWAQMVDFGTLIVDLYVV